MDENIEYIKSLSSHTFLFPRAMLSRLPFKWLIYCQQDATFVIYFRIISNFLRFSDYLIKFLTHIFMLSLCLFLLLSVLSNSFLLCVALGSNANRWDLPVGIPLLTANW
jgi:hypothetical protein